MADKKPFTWSYSALTSFETCPYKHFITKIAKLVPDSVSDSGRWGLDVHDAMHKRVGKKRPLEDRFQHLEPIAATFDTYGAMVSTEQKLALTADFKPCGYFDPNVWVRVVLDVAVRFPEKGVSLVADYKTGKRKIDIDQLELFAATEMHTTPWVNTTSTTYIWLQEDGKQDTEVWTRDDLPRIWQNFLPRVQRMEHAYNTDTYPKTPNGLCAKYCPVGKSLCEFCGER